MIGYTFILFGLYIIVAHWLALIEYIFKRKHRSWVPFFGGSCLAMGIGLLDSKISGYWWVAFFIDIASFPYLFYLFYLLIRLIYHKLSRVKYVNKK